MNTSLDTRNAKPKAKRPEPTPRNVQAEGVRPTVEVEGFFLLWGKVASGLGW